MEDFDVLGFTFFNTKTRGGKYRLGIQMGNKRLKVKKQAAKEWLKGRPTKPVAETMYTSTMVVQGIATSLGPVGTVAKSKHAGSI